MKIKKLLSLSLIFLLILTFSASYVQAGESNDSLTGSSQCGLTSTGVVKPLSGEICPEDKSFRFFYKLFPDVFDKTVLKVISPGYLDDVKTIESNNIEVYRGYQYALLYGFNAMIDLAFFILGFFILYYAIMGLLRSMENGKFLGEDWSVGGLVKKYGFIAILLVPIGNGLVLGQIVVFILIIAAIYLANYLWGAYLSFLEVGDDPVNIASYAQQKKPESEVSLEYLRDVSSGKSHLDYNAEYFSNKIIDISLCKKRTENYLVEVNSSQIKKFGIEQFSQCLVKDNVNAQVSKLKVSNGSNFSNEDSFVNYNLKEVPVFENNTTKFYKTDVVNFGSNPQNSSVCQNFNFDTEYNCGSIKTVLPSVASQNVTKAIEETNFYSSYLGVSSNLTNSFNPEGVTNIVMSGWESIYSDLVAYYTDNQGSKMSPSDEEDIKVIAYIYHQLILNDLLVGNASGTLRKYFESANADNTTPNRNEYRPVTTEEFRMENGSSPYLLTKKLNNGEKIADKIMELICTEDQELYKKGKRMAEQLNAGEEVNGEISSACLNLERGGNVSFYGEELGDNRDEAIATKEATLKAEVLVNYNGLLKEMKYIFGGTEFSLFKAMAPLDSTSLVHTLRKEGWFSLGSYIFKISKEKEIEHKLMMALRNSFTINSDFTNSAYLGKVNVDLAGEGANVSNNFNVIHQYKKAIVPERDMDFTPNIEGSNYINDYLSSRLQNKDTTYSTATVSSVMSIFGNPFASFKQSLGYNNDVEFSVESLMECTEDASKCAIPMENPLIGISDFGSQLIEMSIVVLVAAIAIDFIGNQVSNKYLGNTDAIMKKGSDLNKGSKGLGLDILSKGADKMIDFISIIMSFMVAFAGAMLILGIMLAYAIPLIPFIAFTFAFISWLVFCLQVLFLFPLWCVFSLRIASEQDANSDMYRATYNLIIQILFKPIIVVGVYILMWSLLAVMVAVINYTVVTYMLSSIESASFFLVEFAAALVLLIIYAILIFTVVKMLFKTLHSIVKKIFGYLKVESSNDVSGVDPQEALKKAMTAGVAAGLITDTGGKAQRKIDRNRRERIERKMPLDRSVRQEASQQIRDYDNKAGNSARRNKKNNYEDKS